MSFWLLLNVIPLLHRASAAPSPLHNLLGAVDHIYYINLDRSEERREALVRSLRAAGIAESRCTRVTAIDGLTFTKEALPHIGSVVWTSSSNLKPTKLLQVITWNQGALGRSVLDSFDGKKVAVTLSHAKAAREAFRAGHETVLILEDDVRLDEAHLLGFAEEEGNFQELLSQLPDEWRVLQLGHTCEVEEKVCALRRAHDKGHAVRYRSPCDTDSTLAGLHAYLLSRRGMLALLRRFWPGGRTLAPDLAADSFTGLASRANLTAAEGGTAGDKEACVFDLREATNAVADYALYAMPGVYLLTKPAFLPPVDHASTLDNEEPVKSVARALIAKHFTSDNTQSAVSTGDVEVPREQLSGLVTARASLGAPFSLGSSSSSSAVFYSWRPQRLAPNGLELFQWSHFDSATLTALANCNKKSAPSVPQPDFCAWALAQAWRYAQNCGLASLHRTTALMASVDSAIGSGEATNNTSVVVRAHLMYSSGLSLQMEHIVLEMDRPSSSADSGECRAAADALAEEALSKTLAESFAATAVSEAFLVEASASLRPALRLLAQKQCSDVAGRVL